jgi:hypothetical protein
MNLLDQGDHLKGASVGGLPNLPGSLSGVLKARITKFHPAHICRSERNALDCPSDYPACRRREARLGSCAERENLHGDAKGKGSSGANREAESADAPVRGGLLRNSEEAG